MPLLGGGCDGNCTGVRLRDEEIRRLREQNDELFKANVALVDAKAYALRFPAARPPARPQGQAPDAPATGPNDFRRNRYSPPMSSEEVEASFAAQAATVRAEQERES